MVWSNGLLNQVVGNELFCDLRWREGWSTLFWKPDWAGRLNWVNLNPDISPILKSTKLGNRSNHDKPWGLLNAGTELIGLGGNGPPKFWKKINSIYNYLIFSNLTKEKCYVHNIFITNQKWLVVIDSNLNLTLKLLFFSIIIACNNMHL